MKELVKAYTACLKAGQTMFDKIVARQNELRITIDEIVADIKGAK